MFVQAAGSLYKVIGRCGLVISGWSQICVSMWGGICVSGCGFLQMVGGVSAPLTKPKPHSVVCVYCVLLC